MRYGNHNEISPYYMDETNTKILAQTTSQKDVGVTFTNGLKFETHVNNIVSKANQVEGLKEVSNLWIMTCLLNYTHV